MEPSRIGFFGLQVHPNVLNASIYSIFLFRLLGALWYFYASVDDMTKLIYSFKFPGKKIKYLLSQNLTV